MQQLEIRRLGHQGDGIAEGPVFVPLTLPGEVVEGEVVDGRMVLPRILQASDHRQRPPCPHYKACGGCSVQHARDEFVAAWKIAIVQNALAAQDLSAPISGISTSPPGTRRRATLHGRRTRSGALVGFHGRASDLLTDVPNCLVLDPALLAMLPGLREITDLVGSRKGELDFALTLTDSGIDLAVSGGRDVTPLEVEQVLVATQDKLCRLSWNDEVVAQLHPAHLRIAGTDVSLPAGAFLQATLQGEATLIDHVESICKGAPRIADLFAGIGTFALPLAAHAQVTAFEGDDAMRRALARAAHESGLPLNAQTRDLFRQPLEADELAVFDVVVIDPPRAGAEAQAHTLADSKVAKIASVSCNPITFARDAKILAAGGYRIQSLQVIDQFRWSSHVELVALLAKE
ncbi:MAG: class I SAM-dependent RNA methyltransferase [Deltaproteobacteria bacterium]